MIKLTIIARLLFALPVEQRDCMTQCTFKYGVAREQLMERYKWCIANTSKYKCTPRKRGELPRISDENF
jgi:hypothetical protein